MLWNHYPVKVGYPPFLSAPVQEIALSGILNSQFHAVYVYLNFCNSNLEKTGRDLQVLRRFHDSYDGALVIVNIFLYDNKETVKRMAKPFQEKMKFATVPNSDALRHIYDVKGIPSYLLLDKEGKFLMTKGTEPNDELRLFLQNTLQLK